MLVTKKLQFWTYKYLSANCKLRRSVSTNWLHRRSTVRADFPWFSRYLQFADPRGASRAAPALISTKSRILARHFTPYGVTLQPLESRNSDFIFLPTKVNTHSDKIPYIFPIFLTMIIIILAWKFQTEYVRNTITYRDFRSLRYVTEVNHQR